MAESAPTERQVPQDERDVVAKKLAFLERAQKELESAEFDATQKESFGKFDIIAPNKDEETYQSYLDKRPAAGIIRNGDLLQEATTGKFASAGAYEAQVSGDAQDYYDKVNGIENNAEHETPSYEDMGVMQLAKEASKARALGDRAGEEEVRAAIEQRLTEDIMHSSDDSESAEDAQIRYDAELAHYDALVSRFADRAEAASSHADETHSTMSNEGAPVEGEVEATVSEVANTAETVAEEASSTAESSEASASSDAAESTHESTSETAADSEETFLHGEKITLGDSFVSPDGKQTVYQVEKADGSTALVFASELTFSEAEADTTSEDESSNEAEAAIEAATDNLAAEADADPETEKGPAFAVDTEGTAKILDEDIKASMPETAAFAVDSNGEVEVLDEELLAQTEGLEADPRIEEEREANAEKKSKLEKMKDWFKKERTNLQEYGGFAYFGNLARRAGSAVHSVTIDAGVKEGMTEEEVEQKRKRNRIVILAGVGALAVAGAAGIALGIAEANNHAADIAGGVGEGATPQVSQETIDILDGKVPDVVVPPVEVPSIPVENFNIGSGLGGEQLFVNLGIDPNKWYANQDALVTQFPNDFYRMDGGGVGIAHTGWLSQGAQDFISTLK